MTPERRPAVPARTEAPVQRRRRARRRTAGLAGVALLAAGTISAAGAGPASAVREGDATSRACGAAGWVEGYSDALDKRVVDGVEITELSALAYDARRRAYASVVDDGVPRLWFFDTSKRLRVVGSLTLRMPDGTPYGPDTFDGEGLAVLPDGDYLVSSETEPAIRRFDRSSGREKASLDVPQRFRVAPAGEAKRNATVEGLAVSPDGRYVYAAMEGPLSGDAPTSGEATTRRILVYRADRDGRYRLLKQIGYMVDPASRISEVAAYGASGLLVLESVWRPGVGNTITVYGVPDTATASDVSAVANLAVSAPGTVTGKSLVADVTACPSLGATNPGVQTNPLLDNYEGMYVAPSARPGRVATLRLISDDNGNATQVTRLLTLSVRLP